MAEVLVERRDDGVAVVTLHDPERRNAMTPEMGDALRDTFLSLATDATLRVAVLTGTAPAFSAGGDLGMLEDHARRTFYERFLTLQQLPVPTIAAINGHAVGAGLCVGLACDIRFVAHEAKVGLNFSRLALHPGMGGSWFLPRILGEQRAAKWLYTGRLFSGTEAAADGLALEALPAAEVLPAAIAMAEEIAQASPLVVRQLRTSLAVSPTNSLDAQLDLEAAFQAVNYGTEDLAEGLAAGRARRAPTFTGQ
jgi:enoyl-CoA hydratase